MGYPYLFEHCCHTITFPKMLFKGSLASATLPALIHFDQFVCSDEEQTSTATAVHDAMFDH